MRPQPETTPDSIRPLANAFHLLALGGAVIASAYATTLASMPFPGLDDLVFLFLIALPVGLVWAVSLILESATMIRRSRIALAVPLLALAAVAIWTSGVPRQIRVALSAGPLTETVFAIERGELRLPDYPEYEPVLWAGGVPIYSVEDIPGGSHVVAGFEGSDSPAGLVRFPDGPPRGRAPRANPLYTVPTYQHVYGPWYRWSWY